MLNLDVDGVVEIVPAISVASKTREGWKIVGMYQETRLTTTFITEPDPRNMSMTLSKEVVGDETDTWFVMAQSGDVAVEGMREQIKAAEDKVKVERDNATAFQSEVERYKGIEKSLNADLAIQRTRMDEAAKQVAELSQRIKDEGITTNEETTKLREQLSLAKKDLEKVTKAIGTVRMEQILGRSVEEETDGNKE